MKNTHLLLIVATLVFLTYHLPVAVFSSFIHYLPIWTLPLFWAAAMLPLWLNELFWRTSRFGSDTYILFHELHFAGRDWKKRKANIWLVASKFVGWYISKWAFWLTTTITAAALWFGYQDIFITVNGVVEDLHPFVPYYLALTIWWTVVVRFFFKFKERVEQGRISYGETGPRKTHFSPEWYEEQKRIKQLQEERMLNSKK